MRLLAYLRDLTAKAFNRSRIDDEMEEEIRSHVHYRADDLERSGLDRATAERLARIEFGGRGRFKEECYEALGGNFIDTVLQDVRFSVRVLRKSPGFTVVAVLTLAVAIGANTVVFGVVNGLILRPLNVPEPQSIYGIEGASDKDSSQSYPNYLDLRDRDRSFDGLAAYDVTETAFDSGEGAARVWINAVSGNYFDVSRIQPYLGRFFHAPDEHGPNSAPYIVLTYAYWHSHFQDDRGVVGRTVRLNKHPFTIVGVAPRDFRGALSFFSPAFFVPAVDREQVEGATDLNARGSNWLFMVLGHLKPGVTPAQATADLNVIGSYLEKTYPKDERQMKFSLVRPGLLGDLFRRPLRAFLTGLTGLAGLMLLAACANLGTLFAARAADRSREIALRLALGGGRKRILRQLFTEAILISLVGGAIGVWGSAAALHSLSVWQPFPRDFPVYAPINPDATVYGLAFLLTLASGFLFGAVPLRQILRTDPYQVMKSARTGALGRKLTVRDLLLTVQIAICAVLVTSSMVAVRGLARSLHGHLGFEVEKTMLVDTDLSMAGYPSNAVPAMQQRMIDAVKGLSGVEAVGLADGLPLSDNNTSMVFPGNATDLRPSHAVAAVSLYNVSDGYFAAAGTALLSGRTVTRHDDKHSPPVAVVNRAFARKLFGSVANAAGSYYKMPDGTRVRVVGLVEDGKYQSLTEDPQPAMFLSFLQWPPGQTWLVVRSNRDPGQLGAVIRATLRQLDAELPVYIETRYRELDAPLFPSRMATLSLGVLGAMGALLSITGIFGMAAYSVSKRLKELGIRIAVGAQRKELLQAALGRAFKLLAFGSAAGLLVGMLASQVLALIVYQATPRDPVVSAGVVMIMLLMGLVAAWIPAQRALSIDPVKLLREE